MSTIRWTRHAVADLLAIGDDIARGNSAAARAGVERLGACAQAAAEAPRAGRVVPEVAQ
ncbi:type II toxin-antitoxin system RelE/ParE family toxin [Chondromyces crocatus]|uniref:type II toxin-antitoxin system RelE/ParE family toxin n=1 Tax=Chondromyces crocatus TaxID=52 RepID=UPI0009E6FD96